MRQIKLGLIIAKPETEIISEVEKYISSDWAEMLMFPEGYLQSENLEKVRELARKHKNGLLAEWMTSAILLIVWKLELLLTLLATSSENITKPLLLSGKLNMATSEETPLR